MSEEKKEAKRKSMIEQLMFHSYVTGTTLFQTNNLDINYSDPEKYNRYDLSIFNKEKEQLSLIEIKIRNKCYNSQILELSKLNGMKTSQKEKNALKLIYATFYTGETFFHLFDLDKFDFDKMRIFKDTLPVNNFNLNNKKEKEYYLLDNKLGQKIYYNNNFLSIVSICHSMIYGSE
jgi:hypothetical protein